MTPRSSTRSPTLAKKGGNTFGVAVEGLSTLAAIPGWLEAGQRETLDKGAHGIADEIAKKAPGGRFGKAGRDVQVIVHSSTKATIKSRGFAGAKILERGGRIRPKKGVALKMHDGRFVRGTVVIKGRGYWRKGLRQRSKIIKGAYHDAFGNLERHRAGQ